MPAQNNRWRAENIETFDSAENDINFFVDWVWTIANLKSYWLVQANIIIFLKDAAKNWYQYKFRNNDKATIKYRVGIKL